MSRNARRMICLTLVFTLSIGPTAVYAQQPAVAAADGSKINLSYITPKTTVAVVAHPRRVLTAPEMEMLPIEVISAASMKELGFDPLEVEQVLAIAEPPQNGPPQVAIVMKFSKPQQMNSVLPMLAEVTERSELNGQVYLKGNEMAPSLYAVDQQTLIVAHDELLRRLVGPAAPPAPGPMSKLLAKVDSLPDVFAAVVVEPIRPLLIESLAEVDVPPPFESLKKVPDLLSSVQAGANFTGDSGMTLALQAKDVASAEQLQEIIDQMLGVGRVMLQSQLARQAASDDPIEKAMARYIMRINDRMMKVVRPVRTADRLEISLSGEANLQVATIGILVALLLPAVHSARAAARRMQSSNNLRMIGIALHQYSDRNGSLPAAANWDDNGKPLLSWRVHILPYMEYENLYRQFKLDEPWDSDHNRELIPHMPEFYRNPASGPLEPGKTTYLGVAGEGTVFGGKKGVSFMDIADGLSHTIAVVEANDDRAVAWTAPQDWQFDAEAPLAGLGEAQPGGFNVLLLDGSVQRLSTAIDPKIFRGLLTYNGREALRGF